MARCLIASMRAGIWERINYIDKCGCRLVPRSVVHCHKSRADGDHSAGKRSWPNAEDEIAPFA